MAYIGAAPSYGVFDRQVLTGNGTLTTFNLDHMAVPTSLLVVLDGVVQEPEYSYSTSISSGQPKITFSEAPDNNGRVSIVYLGNEVLTPTSATFSFDKEMIFSILSLIDSVLNLHNQAELSSTKIDSLFSFLVMIHGIVEV